MSARRLLWRWSARTLIEDRRQYRAILTLITVAAALSVAGVLAAYHLVTPPENRYGTADVIASTVGNASLVERALVDQGHRFGSISRLDLPIPGSVERLRLRFQDPANGVTAPLLTLLDGRWPAAHDEVAVTDRGVAGSVGSIGPATDRETSGVSVGEEIEVDGQTFTVVGVVENPTDLSDEFVLVADMDAVHGLFELPTEARITQFLVEAPPAAVTFPAGSGRVSLASRSSVVDARTGVALAVNGVSAVAMVEVALLAGAGFAVLARRRSRQYGLLAAAGASPAHLRTAATAGGTIVGMVGAVAGSLIGLGLALIITPALEASVDHRIGFDPLSSAVAWAVVPTMAMATVAASVAARWPARPLSRQPVAHLLASLRPQPAPVGRTTTAGVALTGAGIVGIVAGFARLSTAPAIVGIILAPIGLLLLSPLLVRMIGRWSTALPMPARLGGRAVARHNRRSAAVVAALAIALGIPTAAVVVTASLDGYDRTKAPNLDERSAIVWQPGAEQKIPHIPAALLPQSQDPDEPQPAEQAQSDIGARLVEAVPGATVAAITVAVEPDAPLEQENFDRIGSAAGVIPIFAIERGDGSCLNCDVFAFGERDADGEEILYLSADGWIATPELLAALDVPTPADDVLALARGEGIGLASNRAGPLGLGDGRIVVEPTLPAATSAASVLISQRAVEERGLLAVTVGWWVTTDEPLTVEVRDAISATTGSALFTEFKDEPQPRSTTRAVALLAGLVAGVGIAMAAVSLFGSEAADDLRILESIGADPRTARRMSASVAAALAGSGAVLAMLIGYLALLPLLILDDVDLPFVVPWTALIGLLVVFPLLTGVAGLMTGARRTGRNRPGPVAVAPLVLALALIAAGCSSGSPGGELADQPPRPIAELADTCDPGIATALQGWADEGYAGSITVLGGDRTCAIGIGPADKATGLAVTAEHTFSIGSVTKAVTAAAILDLVDSGAIGLDDAAGSHVSGLDGSVRDLTIRNLLVHSSGLTGYHGQDHVAMTEDEAVTAISRLPLSFEQGTNYSYTNAGYALLALIVETVTEQGFRRYVTEEILVDATGASIGGFWDGEPAAPEPRAVGYLAGGVPGESGDFDGPHWALEGNGGVAMTGLEMAHWTRALFTGRILSPAATELLTGITKRVDSESTELPGWVRLHPEILGEQAITSSGGGGAIGHLMDVLWLPDSDRVIVVTQNASSRNVDNLLFNIVDALVTGTGVPTPPPIVGADPDVVDRLVGTYHAPSDPGDPVDPEDVIDIRIDAEDPRGLLVTTTGPQAIAAVFPLPPGFEGEVARHERNALALANGKTAEGADLRAEFEAQYGPIDGVRLVASVFDGELLTYLELTVGGATTMLVLALDENGGSQGIGIDAEMPSRWFVPQPEGGFSVNNPMPEDVPIVLLPAEGGLEISGPTGSMVATPIDSRPENG